MGAYEHYLAHHGVKGQKWGVRRYQNEDGTLTAEGKARYLNPDGSLNELGKKELGGEKRYNQGRAIGLGLATTGMAYATYAAISSKIFGNNVLMRIPVTIAFASATREIGRKYLEQIRLRKAERGGVT